MEAGGETNTPRTALNSWGGIESSGYGDGSSDHTHVRAFVTILLFDKNYQFLDVAYSQVNSYTMAAISATYTVKEPGYAFLYVSNEHPDFCDVFFDDVTVSLQPNNIIQYNEYYPFGMQTMNSWTRSTSSNNFLYDQGSELNGMSGFYDLPNRNYDATLGRFFQADQMAARTPSYSPYHYSGNSPVNTNDPTGLFYNKPAPNVNSSGGSTNLFSDWGRDDSVEDYSAGATTKAEDEAAMIRGIMKYDDFLAKHNDKSPSEVVDAESVFQPKATPSTESSVITAENPETLPSQDQSSTDSAYDDLAPENEQSNDSEDTDGDKTDPRYRVLADFLRWSLFLPGYVGFNPYFGAEAIYVDKGWSFVGQEGDSGGFFVLAGDDKGKFFSYKEHTNQAIGTDFGVGIEAGRVDYSGDPDDFKADYFYGYRNKIYGSAGNGISIGGGFSWSNVDGYTVITSSVQLSVGISPFLSGGYNYGVIQKK